MDNGAQDSLVFFQTAQGIELRGKLLGFTRHAASFEVYNCGSVLQTSEALPGFKIIYQDRTLYSGRAIVRSLVNTGLVLVCEATLEDGWIDIDFEISGSTTSRLNPQFQVFLTEWEKVYRVRPEYKVVIADLQTFLTDVRLWLEQVELGIRASPSEDRLKLEQDVLHRLQTSVVPCIVNLFERFEAVSEGIEEHLLPAHRAFGRRQIHPLLLCSPFVYRTFQKPLGYAGDYEMVNMMFRDPGEGGSLFAKVINTYALQLPPVVAHRNRVAYLVERVTEETLRVASRQKQARIFNLGCGPAQEIQRFLAQNQLCDHASFTLADFNDETVAHVDHVLTEAKRRHGRSTRVDIVKRSVQHILKEGSRTVHSAAQQFDFIYCAGLFDYLPDRVCRKLMEIFYTMLAPGGLMLVTNVDDHRSRGEMECFLEWHLVHRDTQRMTSLAPERCHRDQISLTREDTGINIFMSVRKPNGES
jgi:extracellular factor (EF) 3-hydroxypalmitic acid methyl ester biosynthesis protein